MQQKTRGIILKTTKYAESSLIIQVLTEEFGMRSFLINGVRQAKAKYAQSLFMPLNLVEIVAPNNPNLSLQRIKDIRNNPCYKTIPFHLNKSSICLFLNEFILKCFTRQHSKDEDLFNFIHNSLLLLDELPSGYPNFHLFFMLKISRFLGIYPQSTVNEPVYFDIVNSGFTEHRPAHRLYLEPLYAASLQTLINSDFDKIQDVSLSKDERKELLHSLLDYYRYHLDGFGQMKSIGILEEISYG